jgi:hypothetical protein
MTLYGSALFLHVVFAVLLVGGGLYLHVCLALIPRAGSVGGIQAHIAWIHVFVKASGPLAAVVLTTGVYMAFAGSWWGSGWPAVSLGLFAIGGATAVGVIDPRVSRLRTLLAEMPEGPTTPQAATRLVDPVLRRAGCVLVGADLAIVFLMTNKPGLVGSAIAATIGLAAGVAAGVVADRMAMDRTLQTTGSTPTASG